MKARAFVYVKEVAMYVPVILGTAREGRQSEKVANFVLGQAKRSGLETEIVDARDCRIAATDNTEEMLQAKNLEAKITRADGLIIVSPEYNHGYPGELKMMLDMLYEQYFFKPVGLCGVSAGGMGGCRVVEQLRQVVVQLHMVPTSEALYFSNVLNLFDEKGDIKDQSYFGRTKKFLDELVWYAKALKEVRGKGKPA